MPIARIAGKLVYFAHVPKCAGTAIEHYLEARFGSLAFKDSAFGSLEAKGRWNNSSPQHIPLDALSRLFPDDFFDASFAVVRHPIDRVASAFLFQREIEGRIAPETGFGPWLSNLCAETQKEPFLYDNHVRSCADFIPETSTVFRLEDGLQKVVDWLDRLAGNEDGPRQIGNSNALIERLKWQDRDPVKFSLSDEERSQVHALFAADYERFGYDPDANTRY
ncbi:Sulfotransferase family protein [Shimia haliotis]|uniref:Sulfotransferase family protein n=2 Tax=Shimia haliotis TaxID=1280847 RepID=A0A1I4EJL9_9RHOB|nr:Sulfotransferase family protein [Shimia haliotis]